MTHHPEGPALSEELARAVATFGLRQVQGSCYRCFVGTANGQMLAGFLMKVGDKLGIPLHHAAGGVSAIPRAAHTRQCFAKV